MNIKKHFKKLILVLVILILFNFCCPVAVKARGFLGIDIPGGVAGLFFWMERGVFGLLNDIFTDNDHKFIYEVDDSDDETEVTTQMYLTPESIIKGKFLIFNANIFEKVKSSDADKYYDAGDGKDTINGRKHLREIISGWYYSLRNFTIVALLSVLVYVGIRMILSTMAQDKAKYKIMFKDWLVALCLVVVMHYIMVATLNITSLVVDAIGTSGNAMSQTEKEIVLIQNILSDPEDGNGDTDEETRFVGTGEIGEEGVEYNIGDAFAHIFLLVAILIYTIIFAIKYLKREFTIIFLILLGPISCITYPIDKIGDGKAQAFNKWLIEFIYNVIIQPFHLLIYIVLVGSAFELAHDNLLYSIVCFAVMIPAEKFIKEMFGFRDKLGSPLGAMATGALGSQLLSKIRGGGSGEKGASGKDGENNSTPNDLPPKQINNERLGSGDDSDNSSQRTSTSSTQGDGDEEGTPQGVNTTENPDQNMLSEQDIEDARIEKELREDGHSDEDIADILGKDVSELNGPEGRNEQLSQSKFDKLKNSRPVGFLSRKGKQALNIHNQRMAKKWGSTSRGRRWVNRGAKVAKLAGRTAATLGGATLGGMLGMMTGKGKEGFVAGAALGNNLSKRVISGASGTASDYFNGMRSDKGRENAARSQFKGDKNQIDKAVRSYRKRKGTDPTRKALNDEINDRFALSRMGLTDDEIDKAIGTYKELRDVQGMDDETALNQAAFAGSLLGEYSRKDFESEKVMNAAAQSIARDKGISRAEAITHLGRAAQMKGTNLVQLPDRTITAEATIPALARNLGIDEGELTQADVKQLTHLDIRLREEGGFDNADINLLTRSVDKSGSASDIIKNFENKVDASIDFINDKDNRSQASAYLNANSNGRTVTKNEITSQTKNNFLLTETFKIDKDKLNSINSLEAEHTTSKTQKQLAREKAFEIRGKSEEQISAMTKSLAGDLEKAGGGKVSASRARQNAEDIMTLAQIYNANGTK